MGASKSKVNRITARDKAILEVKVQRDRLKQYQKKLTTVTERETEIAKEQLSKGNKALALLALKKRNYQNSLLEKTQNQLFTLEQLVQSIEFAQVEAQVFSGLKQGNAILAELSQEIRIEDVERLLEDTAQAIAYQNEVSRMFAGSELAGQIDEDELLAELESLKETKQTTETAEIVDDSEIVLPDVPAHSAIVEDDIVEVEEKKERVLVAD